DGRPRSARIRHSNGQRLRGSRADVSHVRDADEERRRGARRHSDPDGDFPHLNAELRDDGRVGRPVAGVRLSARARAGGSLKIAVAAESDAGEPQAAATPETIKRWSLSSLKKKLIKIGAQVISMAAASPSRWPWSPLPAKCSRDFAAEC